MSIEEAIKKAIEGGLKEGENWKFVSANRYWAVWLDGNGTETPIAVELYFMSPKFWQSLGKAMGWDGFEAFTCGCSDVRKMKGQRRIWIGKWHRFIDHLAEGKEPEDFFKILNN